MFVDTFRKEELERMAPDIIPGEKSAEFYKVYAKVQFVDYPINNQLFGKLTALTLASLSANPDAMLLLLRHGASTVHPYCRTGYPCQDWSQPVFVIGSQLNLRQEEDEYLGAEFELSYPEDRETLETLSVWRAQKLIRCLQYMSRASPTLPVRFSPNPAAAAATAGSRSGSRNDEVPDCTQETRPSFSASRHDRPSVIVWLHTRFSKFLPQRMTDVVPELQHLCRCAIREKLKVSSKLPDGVQQLPLPPALKLYVDMQTD